MKTDLRRAVFSGLYRISPRLLAEFRYWMIRGRRPNLSVPETFDEKLLWLNLNWQHSLKAQCGDKYAMRAYVEACGLGHILPELLGVFDDSGEIDFDALPDRFVLKCTHGCSFNIICRSKSNLDCAQTKRQLTGWMNVDFSTMYGELHYASMKHRIIAEPFLNGLAGNLPSDYKLYCFGGKVHCAMVCTERRENGQNSLFDVYDSAWLNKLPYSKSSLAADRNIPKPEAYQEMVLAAERLSKPFPFVRMDFYDIDGRALLGEMTFTPNGCIDTGYTDVAQRELGRLIQLPAPIRQVE